MINNYKPVIIVVGFNRVNPLKRLLSSIALSRCEKDTKLIISLDYAPNNQNVVDIANNYLWPFGEKQVIVYDENLGLKNHIIKCCDMSQEYGSIIVLEDDLYVSKDFYTFAKQALNFYADDDQIAGISLYKYPAIERRIHPLPFDPIYDHSDVHFIQFASSWGQAWTSEQWFDFKKWYISSPDLSKLWGVIPFTVSDWPDKSWKKYYIAYMVLNDKYFVYPNISLTTNFDDPGTNRRYESFVYQAALKINDNTSFTFKYLKDSFNIYDAAFEIKPEIIKQFNRSIKGYDFETDLYGLKRFLEIRKPYILTTQKSRKPLKTFGRKLKPHEMNVFLNIPGDDIVLARREDVKAFNQQNIIKYFYKFYDKDLESILLDFFYFFSLTFRIKFIVKLLFYFILKKIGFKRFIK